MIAVIISHGGIPWLTTDGLDSLIKPSGMNAESLLNLKKYLNYFENNRELFGGIPYSDIGVIIPTYPGTSTANSFNKNMLVPFIENHVPIVLLETFSKEKLEKFKTIFILDNRFMSDSEIKAIKTYIDNGGKVVSVGSPATYYLNGDFRNMGLSGIIGKNKQNYVHVDSKKEMLSVLKTTSNSVMCEGLDNKVEIVSTITRSGDIVIHFINHNLTKKIESFSMQITLPLNFEAEKFLYYTPDMPAKTELSYGRKSNNVVNLTVPGVNILGGVLIKASKK
jgi:hypothetical protein